MREIKRREDGQKAIETARELEALQRKREMEKRKKVAHPTLSGLAGAAHRYRQGRPAACYSQCVAFTMRGIRLYAPSQEKDDAAKEKQRLLAEIAKDKAERRARYVH